MRVKVMKVLNEKYPLVGIMENLEIEDLEFSYDVERKVSAKIRSDIVEDMPPEVTIPGLRNSWSIDLTNDPEHILLNVAKADITEEYRKLSMEIINNGS